jgi:hypothetical protein
MDDGAPLLNKPDPATFYGVEAGGYTDYPKPRSLEVQDGR